MQSIGGKAAIVGIPKQVVGICSTVRSRFDLQLSLCGFGLIYPFSWS